MVLLLHIVICICKKVVTKVRYRISKCPIHHSQLHPPPKAENRVLLKLSSPSKVKRPYVGFSGEVGEKLQMARLLPHFALCEVLRAECVVRTAHGLRACFAAQTWLMVASTRQGAIILGQFVHWPSRWSVRQQDPLFLVCHKACYTGQRFNTGMLW